MRTVAIVVLSMLASVSAANSQTYYADIGGRTVNVYVPEGFCALTGEDQSEAMLLEFLARANSGVNDVLIFFADCIQLDEWKRGARPNIDSYGYMATPLAANLREFTGTQDDLNRGLEASYSQQFGPGLEEGIRRAQSALDEMDTGIRIEETTPLGYFGYDSFGTYVGLLQRLTTQQGQEKAIIGVFSTIAIQNRLIFFYLWEAYNGDPEQVNDLLATTQIYSQNQHEVN